MCVSNPPPAAAKQSVGTNVNSQKISQSGTKYFHPQWASVFCPHCTLCWKPKKWSPRQQDRNSDYQCHRWCSDWCTPTPLYSKSCENSFSPWPWGGKMTPAILMGEKTIECVQSAETTLMLFPIPSTITQTCPWCCWNNSSPWFLHVEIQQLDLRMVLTINLLRPLLFRQAQLVKIWYLWLHKVVFCDADESLAATRITFLLSPGLRVTALFNS